MYFSRELPFWKKFTQEYHIQKILDIACGTGHHAIIFKEMGLNVDAMDLSESMIAKARENAATMNQSITFKKGDFRQIKKYYPESYNAIVCLGNSLPHVKDNGHIESFD